MCYITQPWPNLGCPKLQVHPGTCSPCSSTARAALAPHHPHLPRCCPPTQGDILDEAALAAAWDTYHFDTVVHFAALASVDESFRVPGQYVQTNVLGTQRVLEAARASAAHLWRFVHVSTDEVYGDSEPGCSEGHTEAGALMRPTNPYAASKAGAEALVRAYCTAWGIPAIITRGNNAYGPRQYIDRVVPAFTLACKAGQPMQVHGSGDAQRCFLHVADVACAIHTALLHANIGDVLNITGDDEFAVLQVAHAVGEAVHNADSTLPSATTAHTADRPHNDSAYKINGAALRALGWAPAIPWRCGLRETVQWYLQHGSEWWTDPMPAMPAS